MSVSSVQLPFGTRVAIEARLKRTYEFDSSTRVERKFWKRSMLLSTQAGILVGYRTLSNGILNRWGEDGGTEYKQKEHFLAALVVTGPRSKPFLANPEDIKEWTP